MAFGNIQVGQSFTANLTVSNQGNAVMTVTGMTGTNGITAILTPSMTSFTVPPGGSQNVVMRFAPTAPVTYTGSIGVTADQTSGINTIAFSGTGSLDGIPIFTRSGKGDNVFNLPAHVTRLRITGHFVDTGSNSNFIVHQNGGGLVNEILRNSDYDGTHVVIGGALIEIVSSGSIQWTFTEVR